jgi:hypothetical protein
MSKRLQLRFMNVGTSTKQKKKLYVQNNTNQFVETTDKLMEIAASLV